jgi:hypothetical protein
LAEIVGVPVLPKMKKQGLFDAIALRCVFWEKNWNKNKIIICQ